MAGGEFGIVELLMKDHKDVMYLFDKCQNTQDLNEKKKLCGTIAEEISKHTFAEEQLLYPLLRNFFNRGADAEKSINEHNQLKNVLLKFCNVEPQDEAFATYLVQSLNMTKQHVQYEEDNVLPVVQERFNNDQQQHLAKFFLKLKQAGPSRPDMPPNVPKELQNSLSEFMQNPQQQVSSL